MKQIEDVTKPILQPMIHGKHPSSLSFDDQKTLARWFSLRSIIFNTYAAEDASKLFFSSDLRANFRVSDEPLPLTRIVLAAALPSDRVDFEPSSFNFRKKDSPRFSGPRFFEATALIRQVAFQLIVFPDKDWFSRAGIEPNSSLGQILKPIWPSSGSRRWPPTSLLGRSGYDSLKGIFGKTVVKEDWPLSGPK